MAAAAMHKLLRVFPARIVTVNSPTPSEQLLADSDDLNNGTIGRIMKGKRRQRTTHTISKKKKRSQIE